MVDEDIGCCATLQKWLIFIVNFLLFVFACVQIGFAAYVLTSGEDDLGFASDVMGGEGDNSSMQALLSFGIIVFIISFMGCCGAKNESKCLLWLYAIVLFFLIMGQAMVVAVTGVSLEYGDSIYESLWQELDADTISEIEARYECCSFNGDDADTWAGDAVEYEICVTDNSWTETCWGMFESEIEDNYDMVRIIAAIFLGVQVLIYLSTHYVIQSIAEAEGVAREMGVEFGAPTV